MERTEASGTADTTGDGAAGRPATLGLAGAPNARDAGGHATADGRRVRTGRVFRSDALSKLTDEDLTVLSGLGLVNAVDLRGQSEVEALGEDRLPPSTAAVHLPILDASADVYALMAGLIASRDAGRQAAMLGDGGGGRYMTGMYRWFVADDGARGRFGRLLRQIAAPDQLPLLYHCTAGKDRTGWTSAVLLRLLGVDEATVRADYLASNGFNRAAGTQMLESLRAAHLMSEPELLRPLLDVREEYLAAAFDEAESRYGSFDAFVADGLGLTDEDRAALVTALVEG